MGLIKIFSGKETIAQKLQKVIESGNVFVTQRENRQNSGTNKIIELFIEEDDFMKVRDAIEDFKMNM
jgi:lipopolysaccharide export system protein LptA